MEGEGTREETHRDITTSRGNGASVQAARIVGSGHGVPHSWLERTAVVFSFCRIECETYAMSINA